MRSGRIAGPPRKSGTSRRRHPDHADHETGGGHAMDKMTIGLLHPGEMGSMVGAAARANGLRVLWASDGRGGQTVGRATQARLGDVKKPAPPVAARQALVSACPPHTAR